MNTDFPPLPLIQPEIAERRPEKPRLVPFPPEIIARRREIARALTQQITPLSDELRRMSEEERKAVFFKLEHEGRIPLVGTDLKAVAEPTENFTLAIPRSDNLDKLVQKIEAFGMGEIKKGHAPNERLAAMLEHIEFGDPKDRLSQTLFDDYDQLIKQEWVICEIEMISVASGWKQQRLELQRIRAELERAFASGIHGNMFEHEEIKGTCRAVIRCTGKMFQRLVEDREWQTKIFWFEARPRFETFHTVLENFSVESLEPIKRPAGDAPIVCIVDSGVTAGNPFLEPITRDELLRSFLRKAPDNPYDEYGHGSGVASLVSYYALNLSPGASNEGRVWVAGARVLDKFNQGEDERLFSKVLAEVVDTFVPLGVRIFNLSVNINNRKWNAEAKRTVPRRSWIARSIDRISREKDVIFVISTGNLDTSEVRSYLQEGRDYPSYFADEDASIFDPGQAALALTVGAIAPSTLATGRVGTATAIAEQNQPSPFTRCGPGIRREIKPELVEFGGNYLRDSEGDLVRQNPGTNVIMASHQLTPAIFHDAGTSFAAPRVAHKLARILHDLQSLELGHISAPLLKAFIVNSASYRGSGDEFDRFVESLNEVQPKHWLNVLGYGMPDHDRATYCDDYSAILFFQGQLTPNKVAYFEIPVPALLANAQNGAKRLGITVGYAPEVQRWGLEEYLGTTFKWRLFRGDVNKDEIIAAMSLEEEGDSEPVHRPNELKGRIGVNLRSRGAIQHDIFEWTDHRPEYSANHYTLALAAYEKWGRQNPEPIPYAAVVRLEDTTRNVKIYTEIKNLLAQIEIQTSVRR